MDMHTDTTAHLAAEGAAIPARATADMTAALAGPTTAGRDLLAGQVTLAEMEATRIAVENLAEAEVALDSPEMVAAILERGRTWIARLIGEAAREPAGLSAEYVTRRRDAMNLWILDMGSGALADYDEEPTGNAYLDACIAHVELCRKAARAAFIVLENTRATNLAELQDKEALLGAYNGEPDKPAWYTADVVAMARAGLDHNSPAEHASAAISALAEQMDRRWTAENAVYERDHEDEEREEAVAHTGAAAHQLMALPASTLADFRAKARAIEWALTGEWDTWGNMGTYGDFAKSLILELLGDARRRELSSEASTTPAAQSAPVGAPIAEGHAVSDTAPDPSTPLGRAISARETLRAERQAWEDQHDDNAPEDMEKRVSAANLAVFSTPAVSVGEIRWKLLENVMEAEGLWSHGEAERYLSNEGGLDGASQRGILFDLDALAEIRIPAFAPDREFLEATLQALEQDGNVDHLMTQRPTTIAGILARAAQVEDHFPAEFLPSFDDYDRMLVRALIGDIKALYAAQPSVSYSGHDEIVARWVAAKLANRLVGESKTSTGSQAGTPEVLAAE